MHEELHNMYASRNIIRVIKSRRIIWEVRNAYKILVGKHKDLGVYGRIIL
jgi:hypothetical protein